MEELKKRRAHLVAHLESIKEQVFNIFQTNNPREILDLQQEVARLNNRVALIDSLITCRQCSRFWDEPACGPVHAVVGMEIEAGVPPEEAVKLVPKIAEALAWRK
jgi:hypothetical protein